MAINQRQRAAIVALAGGQSVSATAETVGVHKKTVSRWRADPEFVTELRRAQTDALNQVLAGLLGQADSVVVALATGLDDGDISIKLRAAALWLGQIPQLVETLNFADRIDKLENRINAKTEP